MKRLYITAVLAVAVTFAFGQTSPVKTKEDSTINVTFKIKIKDIVALQQQVQQIGQQLATSQLPSATTTNINGILYSFTNQCVYEANAFLSAPADTVKRTVKPLKK